MAWTYRQTPWAVFLAVDMCGDMNATMLPEIIAMIAEEYEDPKNVKTEEEASKHLKKPIC